MNSNFEKPTIEMIVLDDLDVLTTSGIEGNQNGNLGDILTAEEIEGFWN